MKVRLKKIK